VADNYTPRLDQLIHEELIGYVSERFAFTATDWCDDIDA
jgi:hypothetical protein